MATTPEAPLQIAPSTPPPFRSRRRPRGVAAVAVSVFAVLVMAASAAPAMSQVRGVAPADSAAVLLAAATSFETEGRIAVAEALYRMILRRFPAAPAAVQARAALALMERRDESEGSTELQVWGTLFGAWLGVAVPGALGVDEPEPYGLGLLIGSPLGFFVSRTVARRTDPTIGQARAITWGGTWGTWQGFGWREVFDIGEPSDCGFDRPCDYGTGEETYAAMIAGGAVGVAAGALLSRGSLSDAQATAANFGALWGSWFGVALGVITDLEDDDLLAATLVGGDVGLAGAALAAPGLGWSRNRWRLVSVGGLLGGVAGLGINLLAEVDDDKAFVAIPLATSLVGLGVGAAGSRDREGGEGGIGPAQGALLEFDFAKTARGGSIVGGIGVGTPLPAFRRLPVERDGGVQWRTTMGVTLLRVGF